MIMSSESQYYFDDFYLDVANRQLRQEGVQLDLNGRYFDALVLLVENEGQLVEKDQFFSEVWEKMVVSDSALTQCIKDIRKQLGDKAADPRYIETVPGYGYRFIGKVEINAPDPVRRNERPSTETSAKVSPEPAKEYQLSRWVFIGVAGTIGGIAAGLLGGLLYGFGLAYAPGTGTAGEMGATSLLLVLLSLNAIIGGVGGLSVSFGMAAAITVKDENKIGTVLGAGLGGLLVGSLSKLLGVDAFHLLFGSAPEGITGGLEGAVLGMAVALGAIAGGGFDTARRLRPVVGGALVSGAAGVLISLAGGRLMGGSLELLRRSFTGSQLRLDVFGRYFGESHFGYVTQTIFSGIEGLLFGACVVGAIVYLREIATPEN